MMVSSLSSTSQTRSHRHRYFTTSLRFIAYTAISFVKLGCDGFSYGTSLSLSSHSSPSAPESSQENVEKISDLVKKALGEPDERYSTIRSLTKELQNNDGEAGPYDSSQLVYGELSVPVLARLLDAVGVQCGDRFLDIGSGDGALVLAAAMLYHDYLEASYGVELVEGLVERSMLHQQALKSIVVKEDQDLLPSLDLVDFVNGDVLEPTPKLRQLLSQTTLAVGFVTTWSAGNIRSNGEKNSLDGRKLPALGNALRALPSAARIVLIDGKLNDPDYFHWEGDLRIYCPDTAPYSIASLYTRI